MIHRHGCEGTPVIDKATHIGPRTWLIYRCDTCRAVELRERHRERTTGGTS